MTKFNKITEDQLDLMHHIQNDSKASQRQIAKQTGFSIGKVNYCLKALLDLGFVKMQNFSKSNKKMNYVYILTPEGIKEKTAVAKKFIINQSKMEVLTGQYIV